MQSIEFREFFLSYTILSNGGYHDFVCSSVSSSFRRTPNTDADTERSERSEGSEGSEGSETRRVPRIKPQEYFVGTSLNVADGAGGPVLRIRAIAVQCTSTIDSELLG